MLNYLRIQTKMNPSYLIFPHFRFPFFLISRFPLTTASLSQVRGVRTFASLLLLLVTSFHSFSPPRTTSHSLNKKKNHQRIREKKNPLPDTFLSPPCTNKFRPTLNSPRRISYLFLGQIKPIAIARRRTHSFPLPPQNAEAINTKDTPFRHYEVLNPCCALLLRTRRNRPTRGKWQARCCL